MPFSCSNFSFCGMYRKLNWKLNSNATAVFIKFTQNGRPNCLEPTQSSVLWQGHL